MAVMIDCVGDYGTADTMTSCHVLSAVPAPDLYATVKNISNTETTSDWSHQGPTWFTLRTVLLSFLISLLLSLLAKWLLELRRLPPGPWGVPFLGVLPKMGPKPYLTIQKWWGEYGDVFSMYMGSRLVVVVNGLPAMKEVFLTQGNKCLGRPWNFFKKLTRNCGIVFTEGDTWREHRRFSLMCLRDFGMGKQSLEAKILEEARYVLADLQTQSEKSQTETSEQTDRVNPRQTISRGVSNIICSIIYGSRFEYTDAVFQANLDALEISIRKQNLMGMIQFIPAMEILPKIMPKNKMLQRNVDMRDKYAAEQLAQHQTTLDRDNPRDFIDAYLTRMAKLKEAGTETTMEERQLHRLIQDLFIAGSETTATTLKWAFLFMMLHPEVQAKVQAEIDTVVGSGQQPRMHHRDSMPYTCATLMECQRLGNIALFSVPRLATEDIHVGDRVIPKGAWIFVNRWGMHASPEYWPEPNKFDPTRFLDDNGKLTRPDAYVPFGIGPRSCLGEGLARMELFLFFTSVLQAFHMSVPEGMPEPSLEPCYGINMAPKDYEMSIQMR